MLPAPHTSRATHSATSLISVSQNRERQRYIPRGPAKANTPEEPTPRETNERAPRKVTRDSALGDEVLASDFSTFGRDPERLALEPAELGLRGRLRLAGGIYVAP